MEQRGIIFGKIKKINKNSAKRPKFHHRQLVFPQKGMYFLHTEYLCKPGLNCHSLLFGMNYLFSINQWDELHELWFFTGEKHTPLPASTPEVLITDVKRSFQKKERKICRGKQKYSDFRALKLQESLQPSVCHRIFQHDFPQNMCCYQQQRLFLSMRKNKPQYDENMILYEINNL